MSVETKNKVTHQCSVCSNIEEHILTSDNFLELADKSKNTICKQCANLYKKTSSNIFPSDQVYQKYYMEVKFIITDYRGSEKLAYHNFPLLKIFKKEDITLTGCVDVVKCKHKLEYYKYPKQSRGYLDGISLFNETSELISAKICIDQRSLINLD